MNSMNNQMEGKTSEDPVAPEMSCKRLKRDERSRSSAKGKPVLKKNPKKQSKRSAKTKRRSISYEYEMKSHLTWEFADMFQNIDNWHESMKRDDAETKPVKIEPQMMKTETVDDMLGNESSVENTTLADDRHIYMREDEPVAPGGCTATFHGTVVTHSTSSVRQLPVNVQNYAHTENSAGTSAAPSHDISSEETFEKITKKSRKTPGYRKCLKRKPINDRIIKQTASSGDDSEVEFIEVFLRVPEMFEHQELFNAGANNDNTDGVEIHTNQKEHLENAFDATDPKRWNQTKKKPFKCSDCQKEFTNDKLTRHNSVCSAEKPIKCTNCPKMFLTKHQGLHSGEKPLKCTECPMMFSAKGDLTRHKRIHSGEKPFKCTECPKMFSRKSNLTAHQRVHSGEKPFKCTECPKMFSAKNDLTRHQRLHSGEKPFKCAECPQVFSQKSNLTTHQRVHSGEKPFKCTECPKMFSLKRNLMTHQRIHSGEKPFKCAECPKMFSRNSTLTTHQRIHSGEKPFKCTLCPKAFSDPSSLKHHMRIHSGELPLKCPHCLETFTNSNRMKRHILTHHTE